MKLTSFAVEGQPCYGLAVNGRVYAATPDFQRRFPDVRSVLAAGATAELADNVEAEAVKTDRVTYLAPVPDARRILCIGVNYRPHVMEMGRDVPDYPVVFTRFASSLVGQDEPIVRPRESRQFDFEGELAVVIGRPARRLSRDRALDCVAGYSCFMDGSIRDFQKHTQQFTPGKNFDRSGAMGPCIVTADEIGDPARLELTTRINGQVMQRGRLADLVFDIPALIEYCSTFMQLLPGDVIATGTPVGVGAARRPPVWLRAGDVVEVDIPEVGCLRSPVVNEAAGVSS